MVQCGDINRTDTQYIQLGIEKWQMQAFLLYNIISNNQAYGNCDDMAPIIIPVWKIIQLTNESLPTFYSKRMSIIQNTSFRSLGFQPTIQNTF